MKIKVKAEISVDVFSRKPNGMNQNEFKICKKKAPSWRMEPFLCSILISSLEFFQPPLYPHPRYRECRLYWLHLASGQQYHLV